MLVKNTEYYININNLIDFLERGGEFKFSYTFKDIKKANSEEDIKMYISQGNIIMELSSLQHPHIINLHREELNEAVPWRERLANVMQYDLDIGMYHKFDTIADIVGAVKSTGGV